MSLGIFFYSFALFCLWVLQHRYFKLGKLSSFQRQLNLYGFNRITRGKDATGYYHEYFLRHREYLAKRILRKRIKGTKIKGATNPDLEPDFYKMVSGGLDCGRHERERERDNGTRRRGEGNCQRICLLWVCFDLRIISQCLPLFTPPFISPSLALFSLPSDRILIPMRHHHPLYRVTTIPRVVMRAVKIRPPK